MTKGEIGKLVTLATANFPNLQEKDMRPTMVLWEKMLSDMPYELAEIALIKVLSTGRFFPTVAELREAAAQINQPRVMDASEAWGQVMDGLRKFGLYQAREAMEWFSPDVEIMVRRFGWYELCHAENIDVIRGQFMRSWDTFAKGQRELSALPEPIRQMIQGVADNKALPRGEH